MKFLEHIVINPKIKLEKGKNYPFIEMASVSSKYRRPNFIDTKNYCSSGVKFDEGDTVIARIEPCLQNGKKFFVKNIGKGFGSTEYLVFRPKDDTIDSVFLYYLMQTPIISKIMIGSMEGTTGRQRVNNDIFDLLDVSLPDISIQREIGSKLSLFDDLIENNQQQIKLLEEVALCLYNEWFVRLKFPGNESVDIVNGIPIGWEISNVGKILKKVARVKHVEASNYLPMGKYPIIDQSRELIGGYTNDINTVFFSDVPVIVFGDHTRILKLIQVPFASGADGTQLILSNDERMPQHLLYHSLINIDISNYHYARHFKYLKAESILIPTKEIAELFEEKCIPIYNLIQKLRDNIILLQEARDRLLPKLMSKYTEISL